MTSSMIVEQLKRPYLVRAAADGYDVLIPAPVRRQSQVRGGLQARPIARLRTDAEHAYYGTGWSRRAEGAYPPQWVEEWDPVENIVHDVQTAADAIRQHLEGAPTPLITYLPNAIAISGFLREHSSAERMIVAVDAAGDLGSVILVETGPLETKAQKAAHGGAQPFGAMTVPEARKIVADETAQMLTRNAPLMAVFPVVREPLQAQLAVALASRSVPVVVNAERDQLAALLADPNELSRFDT